MKNFWYNKYKGKTMQSINETYKKNHLDDQIPEANLLLEWLEEKHGNLDDIDIEKIDRMIESLVTEGKNTIENFRYVMRYYRMTKRHGIYIHMTRYTGFLDVFENIFSRLKERVDHDAYSKVVEGFKIPVLGTKPRELPMYTSILMERLKGNLSDDIIALVLAGNNHGLPEGMFLSEKAAYEAAPDLASYLEDLHHRQAAELEEHLAQNKVWFEQAITQEVIDFVKSNQEILSARLIDDKLYVTKIPYDTSAYLQADSLDKKRYYGCHCPLAREAIGKVPALFCHCSGGFTKFPFEVIFGKPLPVKSLETILGGSDKGRFEIDLTDGEYVGKRKKNG